MPVTINIVKNEPKCIVYPTIKKKLIAPNSGIYGNPMQGTGEISQVILLLLHKYFSEKAS